MNYKTINVKQFNSQVSQSGYMFNYINLTSLQD